MVLEYLPTKLGLVKWVNVGLNIPYMEHLGRVIHGLENQYQLSID